MRTTAIDAPPQSGIETAPREALAELRLRRLRTTLARREIDVPVETLAVGLVHQLVSAGGDVAVHCEPLDAFTDRIALAEQVRAAPRDRVVLEVPGALPRSPGKAIRVIRQ